MCAGNFSVSALLLTSEMVNFQLTETRLTFVNHVSISHLQKSDKILPLLHSFSALSDLMVISFFFFLIRNFASEQHSTPLLLLNTLY